MKTLAQFLTEASKPTPGITHTIRDVGNHLESRGWMKKQNSKGTLPGYQKDGNHLYLRDRSNTHHSEADGIHHVAHLGAHGNGPVVKFKGIDDLHAVLNHPYFNRRG